MEAATTTAQELAMTVDTMPTARLTKVSPAAGPAAVRIAANDDTIRWMSTDCIKWEAWAEDEIAAYVVCAPDGEYGDDEEDYALIPAADLLDVIAHGYGTARQ